MGLSFTEAMELGENYGTGPSSSSSSGSGFTGNFSKDFGKSFLDIWKNRDMGGSGSDSSKNYYGPTTMGGGSVTPLGDKGNKFLFQYTHPQSTFKDAQASGPGFGAQLAQTAIGAGISAGVSKFAPMLFAGLCDIRTKVDMAPLESTEVNDSLAEIAFFVKGLRECA